eukprot:1207588-Prymnesium_polylepis.3
MALKESYHDRAVPAERQLHRTSVSREQHVVCRDQPECIGSDHGRWELLQRLAPFRARRAIAFASARGLTAARRHAWAAPRMPRSHASLQSSLRSACSFSYSSSRFSSFSSSSYIAATTAATAATPATAPAASSQAVPTAGGAA